MPTITTLHGTHEVPDVRLTKRGLYVTAAEAYEMWQADPERIKILDVRLVEEYIYVGHAAAAINIPALFQTYEYHPDRRKYGHAVNADFIDHVKAAFKLDDTILCICRTGKRSAIAVNWLTEAGFTNIYNVVDGFEGDMVNDPESVFHGKRMRNGWKNSAPWTYELDPAKVWLPTGDELETLRNNLDL